MKNPRPIPFIDFAPDLPPETPGILLDCDNLYGTAKGLRALPSLESVGNAILTDPIKGVFSFMLPSGDVQTIAGTTRHLYRLSAGAWALADGADNEAVATYLAGGRWRMAAFGKYILAVNGVDPLQISDNGDDFVDQSVLKTTGTPDAPVGGIVESTDYGVWLIPQNSDLWYFAMSPLDWTQDVSVLGAAGQITATPGPITACKRLRGGVALYKAQSLYYATFVGPPFVWEVRQISEQVGCSNHEAVLNVGDVHLFLGPDDFYMFDGASLQRLPNRLIEWFIEDVNDTYRANILSRYDRVKNLAFWHYSSVADDNGSLDAWVAVNTRTQKWTRGTQRLMSVVSPDVPLVTTDMTYIQWGETWPLYTNVPNDLTYDSKLLFAVENAVPAVINAAGQLQTYTGAPGRSYLMTGYLGDGTTYYLLSQVRPLFRRFPSASSMYTYRQRAFGAPIPDSGPFAYPVTGPQAVLQKDGAYNVLTTARLHQLKLEFTGEVEIDGMLYEMVPQGDQ